MDFTDPIIRGVSVFHCHLLKHEDKGMMAKIVLNDSPGLRWIDRKPHSNARGVMGRPSAIGSEETIQHEGHRLEPESDIKPHSRGPRLVSEEGNASVGR
jgi:hypothetical protein